MTDSEVKRNPIALFVGRAVYLLRTEEEDVKNNASSVSRLVSRASPSRATITLPDRAIIRLRMDLINEWNDRQMKE